MTHVLRAQTRIVATTKIAFGGVLAMAAFVALISLAPAVLFGKHQDPHTGLEGAATIAAVTAMLLGALQTAGDLQNGMTRALLLAKPRRLRVLGAQLLVSLGQGAGVGVTAALLAGATQAVLGRPGLSAATIAWGRRRHHDRGRPVRTARGRSRHHPPQPGARGVRDRAVELRSRAVHLHPLLPHLHLPARRARESLVHHHSAHHYIPPPLADGLILAGWAAAAALTAALAFTRRDAA